MLQTSLVLSKDLTQFTNAHTQTAKYCKMEQKKKNLTKNSKLK